MRPLHRRQKPVPFASMSSSLAPIIAALGITSEERTERFIVTRLPAQDFALLEFGDGARVIHRGRGTTGRV